MTILTRDSDPWQFEELARRLDGESVSASCGRGSESSFHQWLCVYNLEKSRDGRLFGLWVRNYGDPDNVIGWDPEEHGNVVGYMLDTVAPERELGAVAELAPGEKADQADLSERLAVAYVAAGGYRIDELIF